MKEQQANTIQNSLSLLVKSSAIVFIFILLSKLLTYAYKVILARAYGPEVYGLFTLAVMVIGVLTTFATLGLSEGLLRYVALYEGKREYRKVRYLLVIIPKIAVSASIIFGIIGFFSSRYLAVSLFHNEALEVYLRIFSVTIPLTVITSLYLAVIRSFQNVKLYSLLINVVQNALKLFLLVLFIFIGMKQQAVIASYFFGTLFLAVIAYWAAFKYIGRFSKYLLPAVEERKKTLEAIFSYAWPLVFLGALGNILSWTDSFVIGALLTVSMVGVYNVAFTISSLFGIASDLFMQMFFPMIVEQYSKKNIGAIKEISQQVAKWIFMLNVPLLFACLVFPETIIALLFGESYVGGALPLQILAIGSFVSAVVFTINNNLLLMHGKSKIVLFNSFIAAILNLGLALILVRPYGITGIAVATVTSWITVSIIMFIQVRLLLGIVPVRRKLLQIGMLALVLGLLLAYISTFITSTFARISTLIIFSLIYIGLLFLTKSLDENDKMIVNKMKAVLSARLHAKKTA